MEQLIYIWRLLRIKQWVKNFFIFVPLIFSGGLFQRALLSDVATTFIGFCFLASGLYVFNDFLDSKKDRLHPHKSQRPLARKKLPVWLVTLLVLFLLGVGLGVCWMTDLMIFYIGVVYIIIHLIYNLLTKQIVILDVFFVAIGFQVRIWAGSYAALVLPSVWLQLCVFLLALFLGFTKRRYEISTLKDLAAEHRTVLAHYSVYLLDQIIIICSSLTIICYGLYTISSDVAFRLGGHQNMIYSLVFVIYGLFRYLYLVHVRKMGGDPGEMMFQDKPLLISIILWAMYSVLLLYF